MQKLISADLWETPRLNKTEPDEHLRETTNCQCWRKITECQMTTVADS